MFLNVSKIKFTFGIEIQSPVASVHVFPFRTNSILFEKASVIIILSTVLVSDILNSINSESDLPLLFIRFIVYQVKKPKTPTATIKIIIFFIGLFLNVLSSA